MPTRAIKPKRENSMLTDWQSMPEQAPSPVRADQPTAARVLAMVGVLLIAVGLLAMLAPGLEWRYPVSAGWGTFFLSLGLILVLYHAFIDKDLQFRRVYLATGLMLGGLGILFHLLPLAGRVGGMFMPYGVYALGLALVFLVGVLRNEDNALLRAGMLRLIGTLGAVMILAGLIFGQFSVDFLAGEGVLLLILGVLYVGAFIGMQDVTSNAGYAAGLGLGIIGAVSFVFTLIRVLAPAFSSAEETTETFLVPSGLILLGVSIAYVAVALAVCSDRPLVVLVRRELAAFFYSPMAYLVLMGMMLVAWLNYMLFVDMLTQGAADSRYLLFEPIVSRYIIGLIPVIAQIFVVPVLTMRLFSEEKRTGTLEMMLTVPVNETTITLSKFLAAWLFYLLTWVPTFLFLVGMRALGGGEFDYRPLLSFAFAVMATGAGFIAMGVFFSSLTKNQIIAALFTFVGMIVHLVAFFLAAAQDSESSVWGNVFNYVSFVNLWFRALDGILAPRYLVFHVSAAIFFLYLTNKVLQARKWV